MKTLDEEKIIELIPQTWGEALQKYPWIEDLCKGREWNNRTTGENLEWLINEFENRVPESPSWIQFTGNEELFNKTADGNGWIKFEDGTVIRYEDGHPFQKITHFKPLNSMKSNKPNLPQDFIDKNLKKAENSMYRGIPLKKLSKKELMVCLFNLAEKQKQLSQQHLKDLDTLT